MIPLTDADWQKYKPEGIDDLAFLAHENVPVYVQVNSARHLVYCYLQAALALPGKADGVDTVGHESAVTELSETFPVKRFCNDVLYLQLSNKSYEQVAHSRRAVEPTFSGGGLSRRRVYTVTGRDRRGREIRLYSEVRIHDLERVAFDRAILINALAWNDALKYRRDQMLRGEGDPGMGPPESFAVAPDEVTGADLYLDAEDVERMKARVLERQDHGNYPFDHKERMPVIYLMYQAAWLLNERKENIDPRVWIAAEAKRKGLKFTGKEIYTAAKFAKLELDRARGGKRRGSLQTADFVGWGDGARYRFAFVSSWLSFVLALADWWNVQSITETPPPTVDLAKKLLRANFAGHEVGHLTSLISGNSLTEKDLPELQLFVKGLRKPWRSIFEIDKRRRKSKGR